MNPENGTFVITDVPAGSYYIRAKVYSGNYENQWLGVSEDSGDCSNTPVVTVAESEVISGQNFYLDAGSTISGNLYKHDGVTPETSESFYVYVQSVGGCSATSVSKRITANDGTYTLEGLPPGQYELRVEPRSFYSSYFDVWWAQPRSVPHSWYAESFLLRDDENLMDMDFQLIKEATLSGALYQSDGVTESVLDN